MWSARREIHLAALVLTVAAPRHIASMEVHTMKQNPARELFDAPDIVELLRRDRANWTRDQWLRDSKSFQRDGRFEL